MPSGKEAKDDRRQHKDRDRDKERDRHRDKDRDRDREHRKKDRPRDDEHKERRHRDKENDDRTHRDRPKHRDEERKDKDRPRKDRDDREHRRDRHQREERDVRVKATTRKPKEDGERRKHRDKDDRQDDRERRSKHRDESGRDKDRRRDKDDKDDSRRRDKDRDENRRHKDRDEDRHHKDRNEDRRPRDTDEEKPRRHKERDEDDEERRKRHEERKARKKREEKEREEQEKLEKERKEKEKEEENGDYDYDDDFEDYDDDFEDDDGDGDDDDRDESSNERDTESYDSSQHNNKDKKKFNGEMDEILDAMNKENERLLTESRKPKWSEEPEEKNRRPVSNTKQTFINFVSAKQRQMSTKALSTAARRGYELQEMIELDVSEYDMFDMPPVTEYTMYMRSFGSSNTKQAYVQTNEDNIDRDIQTEEIEYSEKWTQQPPSDILASGGSDDKKSDITEESYQPTDMAHLSEFIERASQVMTILLEEDFLDTLENKHSRSKQSNIIISDAFTEITVPDFLAERPVVYSHFSPVHTHMLLTLHATSTKPSSDLLTRQGCLCVWNVNEPTRPQKVLMCESRPKCCCFSPTKTSLVFAGMVDGSIVCWDTREASSMHKYHKHGDTSWLLRYPTYNTAGVLHYENHQSPVTDISTIVAPGESASASLSGLAQAGSGEGLSFQLASLEQNGVIHLWVVAELSHSDLAGSESDYGLAPGGKVKLVKSSTIQLESPLRDARYRTTMKCADMQLLPSNNSHYYVATDTGCVVHGLRYGGKAPPRAYRPLVDNLVQVRTVDFSPFPEPVFLTGCEDGSLRLYHIDKEWPVATWPLSTDGCPIRLVRWCRSRPAVFFVLDSESRLHIWDLLMDDSSPLKQEAISKHSVTSLALSNDYSATGLGLPGRRPQMVVCLENGSCEIHTMNQQFSALMADEVDQFSTFLQKNC